MQRLTQIVKRSKVRGHDDGPFTLSQYVVQDGPTALLNSTLVDESLAAEMRSHQQIGEVASARPKNPSRGGDNVWRHCFLLHYLRQIGTDILAVGLGEPEIKRTSGVRDPISQTNRHEPHNPRAENR